jgi:hypothetical protein
MRATCTSRFRSMNRASRFTAPRLAAAAVAVLALALLITACENVSGYGEPTLIRVIDASYVAPAVNVTVNGTLIAANIGQGAITSYGTLNPSNSAIISVNATTPGPPLLYGNDYQFPAGGQSSVFITDNAADYFGYGFAVLQDQQTSAPNGHSSYRFLNQAINTGAVDVYMIPTGVTIANAIPLIAALPVNNIPSYVNFISQPVTIVITPAGLTKPAYTSAPIYLSGGEVRTVLIVDTQLTSNPPVTTFTGDDVN